MYRIGKCVYNIVTRDRDDRKVVQTGMQVINKLELSKNAKGGSDWFCTTKVP